MEEASCFTVKEWEPTSVSEYEVFDLIDKNFKKMEVREASDSKTTDQPMLQEVLNAITSDSGIQRKSPVPAVSQKAEATIEHQDILDWQYTAELIKELEKYLCEDPSDASFKEVEVGEASDFKTDTYLQEIRNDIILDCGIEWKSPLPTVSQKAKATIEHQDIWQYTTEVVKELEKYLCEDPSDSRFREVEVREASHFTTADQPLLQEVLNAITSDSGIERKSAVPAVSQKEEATIEHQDILDWQYTAEQMKELEKYLCEDPSDASFKEVEVREASDFKTTDQLLLQEVLNVITSDSGIKRKSPVPAVSQKEEAAIEHQDILDWQYTAELMKELEKYIREDPSDASFKEVEVEEASDFKTDTYLQELRNDIILNCGIERKSSIPTVSQKAKATIEHQDIWQYTAEVVKELEKYLCEDPSDSRFREVEVGEASHFKTADQPLLQEVLNAITSDSGIERKSPVPAVSQKAEATIEHQDILDWQYTAEQMKELEKYICEDPSDASFKEVEVREASDFKTTDQLLLQEFLNVITSDSDIKRKSPVPAVSQKEEATIEHQDILDWQYTAELMKELEKYICEDPSDASFKEVEVREASDFKTTDQPMLQEVLNVITSDSGIKRKSPVPAVSQKEEATIEHQDILDWQYTAELMKELEKYICEDPSDASFKEVEVGEASDIKTDTYLQELRNDIILDCGIERKSPLPAVSQKAEATMEHQDIWQYTAEVVKELEKYLCEDPSDGRFVKYKENLWKEAEFIHSINERRFREVEVGEASHFKTADQPLLQEVRNDMTSQPDIERKSPVPTVKYPEIKMEEASCFTVKEWEPTSVNEYEVFDLIAKKLKGVEVREALDFKTAGQLLLQEVRNDITSDSGIERNQPTNTSETEDPHQGKEHVNCLLREIPEMKILDFSCLI